jgi:hypothetical protein
MSRIPRVALVLGVVGALPFWAAAIALLTGSGLSAPRALAVAVAYGAIILSFLGGIRWGAALGPMAEGRRALELSLSVLPAMAGFASFFLAPIIGVSLLIGSFFLQAMWDVASADRHQLPSWFGRLRALLSILVVLPLILVLARVVTN